MAAHRMRRVIGAVVTVALSLGLTATTADALFTDPDSASHTLSTAVLEPASGLTVAHGPCVPALSVSALLNWTPTSSTWADGYEIRRATGAGGPFTTVGTVSGRSTTTYTDTSVLLLFSTTYRYTVRATKQGWRSADSEVVTFTTKSALCT